MQIEGSLAALVTGTGRIPILTTNRIQGLTGSGGTLTIASSENITGANAINLDPNNVNNAIRLGIGSSGAGTVTTQIGTTINSLINWNGLVIKGSTAGGSTIAQLMANQSFTAGTQTTELDVLGGTLLLAGTAAATTATFEGDARLTGGTIDGGGFGTKGTIALGGDLISDGTTLTRSPNISMTTAGTTTVSGSAPLLGIGTFTKNGAGTVQIDSVIGAGTVLVNTGTVRLGNNDRIADSTDLTLGNNTTLATGGFSEAMDVLTIQNNATLDFGAGSSVLEFNDLNFGSGLLTINNWSGSVTGGGADQLIFHVPASDPINSPAFLNNVFFTGIGIGAKVIDFGSYIEIVPVPEPSTYLLGLGLIAGGFFLRRRLRRAAHESRVGSREASLPRIQDDLARISARNPC